MTIRLLAAYKDYPNNSIVTLDGPTETGLVNAKLADTNLTGGVVYNPTLPDVNSFNLMIKTVSAAKFAQVQAAGVPADVNISYRVTETGVVWKWNILSAAFVAEGGGGGGGVFQTVAYSASVTLNCSSGSNFRITLAGNTVVTITNLAEGSSFKLEVIQSAAGNNTLTINNSETAGGVAYQVTQIANAKDTVSGYNNGSKFVYATLTNRG